MRAVLELAGIRDILAKSLGTTNPINMVKATVNGLQQPAPPRGRRQDSRQDDRRGAAVQASEAGRGRAPAAEPPWKRRAAEEPAVEAATEETPRLVTVKVTQTRSPIGQSQRHRGTLRALGLGKIGRIAEHKDGPVLAGMLRKVRHLVRVEDDVDVPDELNLSNLKPAQPRKDAQARRPRPGLGQGPLLRPRDQGPEVALGLAQDARRLRGRPDAALHAPRQAARRRRRRTRCRSARSGRRRSRSTSATSSALRRRRPRSRPRCSPRRA